MIGIFKILFIQVASNHGIRTVQFFPYNFQVKHPIFILF